jgi:hypothetical protein
VRSSGGRYGITAVPGSTITVRADGSTSSMVSRKSRVRTTSGAFWYSLAMARNREAWPVASAMRASR